MDNLVVRNPIELALAWGSSPAELAEDVFEHSICGILLTTGYSVVIASAAVGVERTRPRTLQFPFSMEEFEVLLRTVERDADDAMGGQDRERLPQERQARHRNQKPQRQRAAAERKLLPCGDDIPFDCDGDPDGEDDIELLWTVPDKVVARAQVYLIIYGKALNEFPD